MKIDPTLSKYHEDPQARQEFDRVELRHCRQLLRRLRFLEFQINKNGGLANGGANGGAAFAEWEAAALEWVLVDIGFLPEPETVRARVRRG